MPSSSRIHSTVWESTHVHTREQAIPPWEMPKLGGPKGGQEGKKPRAVPGERKVEWCVWEWSAVETQPSPILQHFYHGRGDALIRPTNEVEP